MKVQFDLIADKLNLIEEVLVMLFKKLISLIVLLSVCLLVSMPAFAAATVPAADFTQYVPLRLVGESLGYEIVWNDSDRSIDVNTISLKEGKLVYSFSADEYVIIEGGAYIALTSLAMLGDSESYVAVVSTGDSQYEAYRDWFTPMNESITEGQSFQRTMNNKSCAVTLFSKGSDQAPGGPITAYIKVSIKAIAL